MSRLRRCAIFFCVFATAIPRGVGRAWLDFSCRLFPRRGLPRRDLESQGKVSKPQLAAENSGYTRGVGGTYSP